MMLNRHYKQTFPDKIKHFPTKTDVFRQNQTFSEKNRCFQTNKTDVSVIKFSKERITY